MSDLVKKINKFIRDNSGAPAQRSAEWYLLKQKTIGGSEVATVLGLNPFKKPQGLIAEKIGLPGTAFNGNIATRWGNLFETVTKDYTAKLLKMTTTIKETGSIEGVVERQRYSPDGLGVVKLKTGEGTYDYFIVLFEFKAPFRSIPDGKVPKQYLPQVLTGMLTIDIVETGIFVNNCYRKCALPDINFDVSYDTVFHDGDLTKRLTKKQAINKVYAVGMICFYQTKADADNYVKYCGYADSDDDSDNECNSDTKNINGSDSTNKRDSTNKPSINYTTSEYDIDLLLNSVEKPIDFGATKYNIINRVLELHDEKRIHAVYIPMVFNNEVINDMDFAQVHGIKHSDNIPNPKKQLKQQYNLFLADCDEKNWVPVGYLPWKLVKTDVISVDSDDNWQEVIEEPIRSTLEVIDNLMLIEDLDERAATYNDLYPCKQYISKKDKAYINDDCSDLFVNDTYEDLNMDDIIE